MMQDRTVDEADGGSSAFIFHGSWKQFAPIALTNLLLSIVTLGIYRFWAITRERRYLWSRSQFIDERLEWTGTGKELLFGFLAAVILFFLPFVGLQAAAQALALQGQNVLAGLLTFLAVLLVFYLGGVARFRMLRYRMGRTYWHGIRGGSDKQGFGYGLSYMIKTVVGYLPAGLLVPWSMVELWNERWGAMYFGPHRINAGAPFQPVMKRFLVFYALPAILFVAIFAMGLVMAAIVGFTGWEADSASGVGGLAIFVAVIIFLLGFYLVIPLIWLIYYAKFYRVVVGGMSLDTLNFHFGARTKNWLMLFLGDAALWIAAALVTAVPLAAILGASGLFVDLQSLEAGQIGPGVEAALGAGFVAVFLAPFLLVGPFLRYRHWKFFVTHMEATGEIDVDQLTQATTSRARHGEGLFDALDVGAI